MSTEKKHITVLFCDMVGSTSLSSALDPEDLREIMVEYQGVCSEVISSYNGFLARYIGDGVLSYFGYPHSDEMGADRTILAALDIRDKIAIRNQQRNQAIEVRFGIHSGVVVIGEMGCTATRQDILATGETPNIAARLQRIAGAGEIAVSTKTLAMARHIFRTRDLGNCDLRGIAHKVGVSIVLGRIHFGNDLEYYLSLANRDLLGRDTEFETICSFGKYKNNNRNQSVYLYGDAGIGKTRLTDHLIKHYLEDGRTVLRLQCNKLNTSTPLFPFKDWAESQPQLILDKVDIDCIKQPTDTEMSNFSGNVHALIKIILSSANLLDDPIPARERFERNTSILAQRIADCAKYKKFTLILEDAQWVDSTSATALRKSILDHQSTGMIVVVTSRNRPDEILDENIFDGLVYLQKLGRDVIRKIVDYQFATGEPENIVKDSVVKKSNGNPLYAVEIAKTVNSMLELYSANNSRMSNMIDFEVPDTLIDSFTERLDMLGSTKWVVQLASIFGKNFSKHHLEGVIGYFDKISAENIDSILHELYASDILVDAGVSRSLGEQIAFRHDLLQEVAYQSLLKATKRNYHLIVAQFMENDATQGEYEAIAYHYKNAGQVTKAIEFLNFIVSESLLRGAGDDTSRLLTRIFELINLINDESRHRHLAEQVGNLALYYMTAEGFGSRRTGATFRKLRSLSNGIQQSKFLSYWGLSRYMTISGNLATGSMFAEKALLLARENNDAMQESEALLILGVSNLWLGKFADAVIHYRKAEELLQTPFSYSYSLLVGEYPLILAKARMSFPLWVMGQREEAFQSCNEAIALAQQVKSNGAEMRAVAFKGWLHQFEGNSREVFIHAERVLELANRVKSLFWVYCGQLQKGWAIAASGDFGEGMNLYLEALTASKRTGTIGRTYHRVLLAEMYHGKNYLDDATRAIEDATKASNKSGDGFWTAELNRVEGEILISAGQKTAGLKKIKAASRIAKQQNAITLIRKAEVSLASHS